MGCKEREELWTTKVYKSSGPHGRFYFFISLCNGLDSTIHNASTSAVYKSSGLHGRFYFFLSLCHSLNSIIHNSSSHGSYNIKAFLYLISFLYTSSTFPIVTCKVTFLIDDLLQYARNFVLISNSNYFPCAFFSSGKMGLGHLTMPGGNGTPTHQVNNHIKSSFFISTLSEKNDPTTISY